MKMQAILRNKNLRISFPQHNYQKPNKAANKKTVFDKKFIFDIGIVDFSGEL